jgi:hypothetical protein
LTSTPYLHTGAASIAGPTDGTEPQMIWHQAQAVQADETDLEDRSTRVIEYALAFVALAFVALAVAGILALAR